MKKSMRLLALMLSVLVLLTTVISTTVISASAEGTLTSYYKTNPNGQVGANKTISIDGSISDWDSSMLIAQGTANDDPRVYRPDSMYEVGIDLYALYGAYDDNNLYLMWEMTNVQDVVAPNDNYPLSQGTLWQTQELPFFIAVDTGKADTAIGNNAALTTGGTIWNSGMTIQSSFNKLISINTKGGNGPFIYGGDSTGLNPKEIYGFDGVPKSAVQMGFGKGILSNNVYGIDGAYGTNNGRVPGDVCDESAAWVDFNTKSHSSSTMDFFYELSIPYSELGITKADVESNGVGVLLVATMGKSAMDCLPGDPCMTDQADLDDAAASQENNSFEKSDEDFITAPFARIGKLGSGTVIIPTTPTTPIATDPVVIPTSSEAPVVTAPTTEGTDPIVIPPVITEPTENTTETPDIIIPTLDINDNTTAPTETKEPEITTDGVNPPVITPSEGILGDTDNNEKVNIKDATLIQKHLAKIETLDEKAQFLSDVDANDVLNIRDATHIQKWIAKMPVEYAIGEPVSKGEIVVPTIIETEATETPIVIPTVVEPTETTAAADPTGTTTTIPVTDATEATEPTQSTTETQPIITDPVTEPIITEPITQPNDGTETIYFVDGTPQGWIGDADAKIYIFNYETNENYAGTMQDENTWTFQVPAGMTAINFYRCEGEFTQTAWNSWTMCVTPRGSENTFTATSNEAGSWTGNSSGGDYIPPDGPVIDDPVTGDYIYFTDNAGWGTVYCHTWNMDGGQTEWPGNQMENVGGNQYRVMVDSTHTNVKFNGGLGGPESNEFELTIGNTYSN